MREAAAQRPKFLATPAQPVRTGMHEWFFRRWLKRLLEMMGGLLWKFNYECFATHEWFLIVIIFSLGEQFCGIRVSAAFVFEHPNTKIVQISRTFQASGPSDFIRPFVATKGVQI